jgi:hypothetical protein
MPEIYSIEGLRYMMRLRKHREAYFLVVSSLAEFLGHLIQTRPPVLAPLPPLDQLSSAFLTGTELRTTADLGFAFLVPSRSEYLPPDADRTGYGTNARDWTPFSRGTPIGQLAAQAAIELGLTYEEIPINADFPEAVRLRLAARAPIVVFVDPNTLRIDRFKPLLQVLISNPADNVFPITTRLDSALMSFPNLGAYIAADEKGIVSAISRAVTKFRLSIISRSGTDQGADLDPLLNLHGGSN